jgi:hypothetical protein
MVIGAAMTGAAIKANAAANVIAQDLIRQDMIGIDKIDRFILRDPPAPRTELHAPVSSAPLGSHHTLKT